MLSHNKNTAIPTDIYLARPGGAYIGKVNGIVQAKLHQYLRDAWEINFEIDKYITLDNGQTIKNKIYDLLLPLMELHVQNIGWFRISKLPDENVEATRIYKTFTAYGIETQLSDLDLILLHVNCGTDTSLEMYDENLDALGIPKHNIQFYIRDESDIPSSDHYWGLGLLNILEHTYFSKKGWSIGDVSTSLLSKERTFEIDSVDGFTFLMGDCANAFRCIFTFDRKNKIINATANEDFGKSLNIEVSFRNLLNSATITDRRDQTYTKFTVQGANDQTGISYVNFGFDYIENLSYMISKPYFSEAFIQKYNSYLTYRESRRQDYADTWTDYLNIQSQIDELNNRQPIDEVNTEWNAYTLDELRIELDKFAQMKKRLEELGGNVSTSPDYELYLSITQVIIPDIQSEISRQEAGSVDEPTKVDYKFNWNLYGINGLKERRATCQNSATSLKQKGYDKPPEDPSNTFAQRQYEQYLKMTTAVTEIDAKLATLESQLQQLKQQQETVLQNQSDIVSAVDITNKTFGFTSGELAAIQLLYIETDYQDSSIEVLDESSVTEKIELGWELLKSAQEELEIECRPQQTFTVSLDNLYLIKDFEKVSSTLENGDFMFMELDRGYKTKQRIIEISYELCNFSNTDLSIVFSDMTNAYGRYDDLRFLTDQANSSSKNSISRNEKSYIQDAATSAANNVLNNYFNGAGSIFPNGISQEDALKLSDALNGLIDGNLSLEELEVKLAKIEHLDAESAFVKYLESLSITANAGKFDNLEAVVAAIDDLLAGNLSAELGHIINLTVDNVNIDEAVIRELIASHIAVSDLMAGDITLTNAMRILSENGLLVMNGETLQIKGKKSDGTEYVAIQLGYDSTNNPSLIIRNEEGAIMLDANGLHEAIVPDEFIQTDMIGDGQVTEDKIDKTNIREWTDESGNKIFDVSKMYFGNDKFSVSYQQVLEDLSTHSTNISQISTEIDNINKKIVNMVTESDIENAINEYDNSTSTKMYDKISQVEQSVNSIELGISSLESQVNDLSSLVTDKGIYSIQLTIDDSQVETEGIGYIHATLYLNYQDVTADYPEEAFVWRRVSERKSEDTSWNNQHIIGKVLAVGSAEIEYMANYNCEFVLTEESSIEGLDGTDITDLGNESILGLSA